MAYRASTLHTWHVGEMATCVCLPARVASGGSGGNRGAHKHAGSWLHRPGTKSALATAVGGLSNLLGHWFSYLKNENSTSAHSTAGEGSLCPWVRQDWKPAHKCHSPAPTCHSLLISWVSQAPHSCGPQTSHLSPPPCLVAATVCHQQPPCPAVAGARAGTTNPSPSSSLYGACGGPGGGSFPAVTCGGSWPVTLPLSVPPPPR